jgi:hypothetical protein
MSSGTKGVVGLLYHKVYDKARVVKIKNKEDGFLAF